MCNNAAYVIIVMLVVAVFGMSGCGAVNSEIMTSNKLKFKPATEKVLITTKQYKELGGQQCVSNYFVSAIIPENSFDNIMRRTLPKWMTMHDERQTSLWPRFGLEHPGGQDRIIITIDKNVSVDRPLLIMAPAHYIKDAAGKADPEQVYIPIWVTKIPSTVATRTIDINLTAGKVYGFCITQKDDALPDVFMHLVGDYTADYLKNNSLEYCCHANYVDYPD